MAAGAWDKVTCLAVVTMATWGGKPPHPDRLNRFRQRAKTKAELALEAKESWMALKAGLKVMAGG